VCHANASRDWFEPSHLSLDVAIGGRRSLLGVQPYLAGGLRREVTRFDIGVILPDGSRDPDHPVLEMAATRAFGSAGVEWSAGTRLRYAAEIFWSPGSLVTVRLLGGWRLR
jgi:hypothetical protein